MCEWGGSLIVLSSHQVNDTCINGHVAAMHRKEPGIVTETQDEPTVSEPALETEACALQLASGTCSGNCARAVTQQEARLVRQESSTKTNNSWHSRDFIPLYSTPSLFTAAGSNSFCAAVVVLTLKFRVMVSVHEHHSPFFYRKRN